MKDVTVQLDITIREAMKRLSQYGQKCLVITDEKNILLGTLSDGDVRKAILRGKNISETIQDIFNKNAKYLNQGRFKKQESKDIFL